MEDRKIVHLKTKGKSLREIASILGVSHEAVRKRLKNLANIEKVSTKERNQELTVAAIEKEKVSNGSNAYKSRASWKTKDTVNRVSTQETPSLSPTTGVNPLETLADKLPDARKGVFQGVDSESGDLFERIKVFLEANGVELYRMQVEQEAYQIRGSGQVIRFYVQRKQAVDSRVPRDGLAMGKVKGETG